MARRIMISTPTRCGVCGEPVTLLSGGDCHALVVLDERRRKVPHVCAEAHVRRWKAFLGGRYLAEKIGRALEEG